MLEHPEHAAALGDDAVIAVQHLGAGFGRAGLRLSPGDQFVDLAEVVLDQAGHDVFLGLEVVVQRGLGDVEPFGDLSQRGLVVALLGEQFQGDRLDPLSGVVAGVRLAGLGHRVPRLPPSRWAALRAGLVSALTSSGPATHALTGSGPATPR